MALSQDPSQRKKQNQYNSYLKYSGLAFQLFLAIGLFGWLGYWLDGRLGFQFPVFMLLFGLIAFAGMMYQIYRSINRD